MDTRKIFSSALISVMIITLIIEPAMAAQDANVLTSIQKMQTVDSGLPSIANPKGNIGTVLGKIFYDYNDPTPALR